MNCNKIGKNKQYEVTFKDETGKNRFENDYGFGTNPPFIIHSSSKKCLIKYLKPLIRRDKVKIVKISLG